MRWTSFRVFEMCFTYVSHIAICIVAGKTDPNDYFYSHLIHIAQPFVLDLFVFLCLVAMLDEDEEDRVDETALQQLTEMGFPESRAIKALRLNQ